MDEQAYQLWTKFEARANDVVERDSFGGCETTCLLQIVRRPSFETVVSWRLLSEQDPDSQQVIGHSAVRHAWLRERDREAFGQSVDRPIPLRPKYLLGLRPTFETHQMKIGNPEIPNQADRILAAVTKTPPPSPTNLVGLDGERIHLILGNHMFNMRISWWESYPEEWAEIGKPTMRLLDLLDMHFMFSGKQP